MKIKSVHIDGFGKWQDIDFSFADNPQAIFGSNEAGKTTLVHFITSILFGFANGHGKNKYDQYKPKNGGSYGGTVTVTVDDADYQIHRGPGKGGGKVTVTGPDGKSKGQAALSELLGPIDLDLYQEIYCFSAQDLADVDSLDRDQLSAELKQIGAAGSRQWLSTSSHLSKEAGTIYRERGRKWPLNQKLKQAKQLQDQIKSAQAKSSDYQRLVKQRQVSLDKLTTVRQQKKEAQNHSEQLAHLKQLWPVYQSLQAVKHDAAQERLSDDEMASVQQLRAEEQSLSKSQERERSDVADRKADLAALEDSDIEFYRQHEPDLKAAQTNAMRLQAARENDQLTAQKVGQWQEELALLHDKYQTKDLPLPLSEHDQAELADLQNSIQDPNPYASSSLPRPILIAVVIGLLMLLVGLAIRLSVLTVIGLVVLALGLGDGLYQRRKTAEIAHDHQRSLIKDLQQFGVDHQLSDYSSDEWLPMQSDLRRAVDLQAQIDDSSQRIEVTRQRIKSTMAEFSRFGHDSLSDWLANLNAFVDRMGKRDIELRAASQRFQTATSTLSATTDQLAELKRRKESIYHQVGVKDDKGFDQLLAKRSAAATNRAKAKGYAAQLSPTDRKSLSQFGDEKSLNQAIETSQAQVIKLSTQERELDETARQCKVEIDALVADGTLSSLQQQMANLNTQIKNDALDWLAHQLAIRWIDAALSKASAGRFPQIVEAAKSYFATLTGDRYRQIDLTESGVAVVDSAGVTYDVQELSQGTAEQLYVALRLGFASVMSKTISLPLIIDDGFVNFDNVRRQRMFKLLKQVADSNQVIYLTADSRIKNTDLAVLDLDERGSSNEQATE